MSIKGQTKTPISIKYMPLDVTSFSSDDIATPPTDIRKGCSSGFPVVDPALTLEEAF